MMGKLVDEKCQKSILRVSGAGARIPADGADGKYRRNGIRRELHNCCYSTSGTVSRGTGNRKDLGESWTEPRDTITTGFNEV